MFYDSILLPLKRKEKSMLQGKDKDRKEQNVSPTSPIHLSTEGCCFRWDTDSPMLPSAKYRVCKRWRKFIKFGMRKKKKLKKLYMQHLAVLKQDKKIHPYSEFPVPWKAPPGGGINSTRNVLWSWICSYSFAFKSTFLLHHAFENTSNRSS